MSYPYLKQLALSDEERARLVQLAAPTPAALLAMVRATPEAFRNFFGDQATQRLIVGLEQMLDVHQIALLKSPLRSGPAMGAVISRRAPDLKDPGYSVAERDRLFTELQELRTLQNPSADSRQRMQELESELNVMLAG